MVVPDLSYRNTGCNGLKYGERDCSGTGCTILCWQYVGHPVVNCNSNARHQNNISTFVSL